MAADVGISCNVRAAALVPCCRPRFAAFGRCFGTRLHAADLAERELHGALALEPDLGEAHALLALCLSRHVDWQAAMRAAQWAVELAPEDPLPHYSLAVVSYIRNQLAEAERSIREAIRLDPATSENFGLLAEIQCKRNRWSEALRTIDRGLALDPDNQQCLNTRATALMMLGHKQSAHRAAHEALVTDPEDARAHMNLAQALTLRSRYGEAHKHYQEALRNSPEDFGQISGVVEELKARSLTWRFVLSCLSAVERLRAFIVLGIFVGGVKRRLALLAAAALAIVTVAVVAELGWSQLWINALTVFSLFAVLLTWNVRPVHLTVLGLSALGRQVIPRGLLVVSMIAALLVAAAATLLALPLMIHSEGAWVAGLVCLLLVVPTTAIEYCRRGWPRLAMTGILLVLAGCGLATAWRVHAAVSTSQAAMSGHEVFFVLWMLWVVPRIAAARLKRA